MNFISFLNRRTHTKQLDISMLVNVLNLSRRSHDQCFETHNTIFILIIKYRNLDNIMKFKIDNRFLEATKNYLDGQSISYQIDEMTSSEQFIIGIDEPFSIKEERQEGTVELQCTTRLTHQIATALMTQFLTEQTKNSQTDLTIRQWLKNYEKSIIRTTNQLPNQDEKINTSLGQLLLGERLSTCKENLRVKKMRLEQLLKQNKQIQQEYEQIGRYEDKKISLSLTNLGLRIDMGEQSQQSDNNIDEQVERIKNVLKNGLWGYLPQISEKIDKITALENEIAQL